ncbi:MAG: prephenate dehydrogenase/arogenate dehydrogenase family protein [Spirochaetales bacterium]|nr:prephenate dehydrogenase/arogenate dehydrogenase family protein [Spirochaetales bacterium]
MTVCMYGMGRFGRFWAEELSRVVPDMRGYNRSDREFPPTVKRVSFEEMCASDVIILTTAISSMEEVLKAIAPHIKKDALIMDCCSVKVWPVEMMEKYLPAETEILATHPMFGPDSGKNGVEGLPIVVSPVRIAREREEEWLRIFQALKLTIHVMTPDEHDREAAFTQGITHFIGRILGDMHLEESPIATSGYKSLQRIMEQTCNDDWQLFMDLQKLNPHTEEMRSKLDRTLAKMIKYLQP